MKPQFIPESKWPVSKDDDPDQVVNPDYDTKIEDSLVDELMMAIDDKNSAKLLQSLTALIQHLQSSGE